MPIKTNLNFTLPGPKRETANGNKCIKCKSTNLEDYSSFNGVGRRCRACGEYWEIGRLGGLTQEDERHLNEEFKRFNEDSLVMLRPEFVLPTSELDRIEETINSNYEFLRRRLMGDHE